MRVASRWLAGLPSILLYHKETMTGPSLARVPHLAVTARERKLVWQSATEFVQCENLFKIMNVLRSHLAWFVLSSKVNSVGMDPLRNDVKTPFTAKYGMHE